MLLSLWKIKPVRGHYNASSKRAAEAMGVSLHSVEKIKQEGKAFMLG
jgi:hypothetical protein